MKYAQYFVLCVFETNQNMQWKQFLIKLHLIIGKHY